MFEKKGKSKRGRWTPEQRAYAARLIENGCIACYLGHGIEGSPAMWHHQKEDYTGPVCAPRITTGYHFAPPITCTATTAYTVTLRPSLT